MEFIGEFGGDGSMGSSSQGETWEMVESEGMERLGFMASILCLSSGD